MIQDLQSLAESHPVYKSKLTAVVRKFNNFTVKIRPYFTTVNILVQTKQEVPGLIWASLQMIFQV
jgi:hypothetical protein